MFSPIIHAYSIVYLQTVDSTNNYAASHDNQPNIQHKTVILASFQSKGKGQFHNNWQSEAELNLLFSIYLLPNKLSAVNQFDLSRISALAIKDTISYFLKRKVSIKWPNDIFVNDKKIAGILIENSVNNNFIDRSIIGIGININQEVFDQLSATSLKLESAVEWKLERVLEFFLYRFDNYYESIQHGSKELHSNFDLHLFKRKEWTKMKSPKLGSFRGRIVGTERNGMLKVEDENLNIHLFNHKEIEFNLTPSPGDLP